jgi:hypothetical protein
MSKKQLHPAMSFNGIRAALVDHQLRPYDFTAYMVILLHADGYTGNGASPSFDTIAREGSMTVRQAQKSIAVLKDKNLITVSKKGGSKDKRARNCYALCDPNSPQVYEPDSYEPNSQELGSHETPADTNMVRKSYEPRSNKQDVKNRITKKEQDKGVAAKAAAKPSKAKKADKPVDPDGALVNEIIGAWHTGTHNVDTSVFQNSTIRKQAKTLLAAGYTGALITEYLTALMQDAFWVANPPAFATMLRKIGAWRAARPESKPAPLHIDQPDEPFERITPERRKALQAEFEKTMAEIAAAKADLPHRVARQQTARKVPA